MILMIAYFANELVLVAGTEDKQVDEVLTLHLIQMVGTLITLLKDISLRCSGIDFFYD